MVDAARLDRDTRDDVSPTPRPLRMHAGSAGLAALREPEPREAEVLHDDAAPGPTDRVERGHALRRVEERIVINGVSNQTRYGAPERGKSAKLRPAKGRLCEQPGCDTVLSTYNADDRCFLHVAPSFRHPLYRD